MCCKKNGVGFAAVLLMLACAGATWGVVGCFGGSSPDRTYFALEYPLEHTWNYSQARYPVQVRVKRFTTALAYDRNEMVYRTNPHEFQYYWYKLWAVKPRNMMREVVVSHLRYTRLFTEVVLDIGDRVPDYDLDCELLAIEELNATDDAWFARLSYRLTLTRFDDGRRLWEYEVDTRKPVYNRQPVFVVRAMSEIAAETLQLAFADLDAFLATETGAPAPAGGPQVRPTISAPAMEEGEAAGDDFDASEGPGARLRPRRP